ncbi:MAG: type II toxin-antitoxin system VapC family toxin [Gemmatimonadales bacterium]
MIQAVDTNVLVYAHLPTTAEHERVRRFLHKRLAAPRVTLAVTPMVLHELVHVITDPRRFDPPVTMSEGRAIARLYLGRSNVTCLAPDEEAIADAFALLEHHQLGRKRIADTLLAATLLRHGVGEIITCNSADFAPFAGLSVVDPRHWPTPNGRASSK